MREKIIEDQIKEYLFKHNIYFFKMHSDAYVKPGIPDLICCWNGRFLGIEVKKPGAKSHQTEQQKIHQRNITKSGGIYLLVDNLDEVVSFIEDYNE